MVSPWAPLDAAAAGLPYGADDGGLAIGDGPGPTAAPTTAALATGDGPGPMTAALTTVAGDSVLRDLVRAACQPPSDSRASSASTAAMMAWTGMRPLAISWPPARRIAAPNGAAHRFS